MPIALEDPFEHFDNSIAGDVRDPYPELADLRSTTPVLRVGGDAEAPPMYVVSRYEDVAHVLLDGDTFSSSMLAEIMGPAMGDHIILGMDEPEHRRHRALVGTAFRQKMLARWETELCGACREPIDTFADAGRAELVRQFTFQFPAEVIGGVLGLPREDFPQFQVWAADHQRQLGVGAGHGRIRVR